MNSGACGGNDGDGGRDKDGKTPEQRHREHIQQMDDLKRREEVLLDSTFLNFFFTPNFHISPCGVMVALPACNRAVAGSTPVMV